MAPQAAPATLTPLDSVVMINNKLKIREAMHGDESDIWHVHTRSIKEISGQTLSPEEVEELLPDKPIENIESIKGWKCFVAVTDNTIVGFAGINLETGQIPIILINPDYIRKGIGSKLMLEMENEAHKEGLKVLKVNSSKYGHKFYKACGFVGDEIGVEVGPKTGMEIPCYIMMKKLN